jgi:acyl dehydratase
VKLGRGVRAGDELPALRRVVDRADLVAYAAASGDRNPLHTDDGFAREAGFPGVIAHGMFTMGHMAACAVAWAGDPARVTAISAAFRAPVYPGDELVAAGRVRSIEAETAVLELWVTVERGGRTEWPIKRGEATVRLTDA